MKLYFRDMWVRLNGGNIPLTIHSIHKRAGLILALVTGLSLLIFTLNGHASLQQERLALVIGNGNYQSKPLKNPINDAKAMTQALESVGFQVSAHYDIAKAEEFDEVIDDFAANLKRRDAIGLVYYAGHGIQVADKRYLLPLDAEKSKKTSLKRTALTVSDIVEKMESARVALNIVIIDACRNDPFSLASRSTGGTRGFSRVPQKSYGTFIASSTSAGYVADDGYGKNSPYTESLLAHIGAPKLTLEQLFKRVAKDVINKTEQQQQPWVEGNLLEDFAFVPQDAAEELEQINKDRLEQQRIQEQRAMMDAQAAEISNLKKELERQQAEIQAAALEQNATQDEIGNAGVSVIDSNKMKPTDQQQIDIDKKRDELRLKEQQLIARRTAKVEQLIDRCDSMRQKYRSPMRAFDCYEDILNNEDSENSWALEQIAKIKAEIINNLDKSLVGRDLRLAKRHIKSLKATSDPLYMQYSAKVSALASEIKAEQNDKPKFITTF